MTDANDDSCSLMNNGGTSCTSDKLFSSQPKADNIVIPPEPTLGRPTGVDHPVVPPRNYNNSAANKTPLNYLNPQNRYPYNTQRLPYGGYSYNYGSSFPYYSSYNSNMYGGYGMNGYNYNNHESRFIRAAEESARPTFEAIESLTRAINSVAFMMESTFGSLNMSFQAIVSVIENFSNARAFLKRFLASILTFRIFHKCLNIIVSLLRKMNILSDEYVTKLMWLNTSSVAENNTAPGVSCWPIFTFFGLILGAPYLISKILPREQLPESKTEWNPATDRSIPLVAVHDFQAGSPEEISFHRGQQLKMIPPEIMPPTSPYWVFVADENHRTGYVPRNHVAPA